MSEAGAQPAAGEQARTLVLASGNPGKLAELRDLVAHSGCTVRPVSDFSAHSPAETGTTFVENAIIKARHACECSGMPAIADDSGLMVAGLGGLPGVRSARYAGAGASDADNRQKLLAALAGSPLSAREACFISVVVYMQGADDPLPVVCEGRWQGQILESEQGSNGFGYDCIFGLPDGRSAADLESHEKNAVSHRALALEQLLQRSPWRLGV